MLAEADVKFVTVGARGKRKEKKGGENEKMKNPV
jgi:hypothetical protein